MTEGSLVEAGIQFADPAPLLLTQEFATMSHISTARSRLKLGPCLPSRPSAARHLMAWSALVLTMGVCSSGWTADGALPAEQQSQGVSYVTGGVDLDESTAIKAAMTRYPLVVEVFNSAGGKNEYTASSDLTLTNAKGQTVFSGALQGPFALLRIPPGAYDLKVSYEGQSKHQRVEVKSGGNTRSTFIFGKS